MTLGRCAGFQPQGFDNIMNDGTESTPSAPQRSWTLQLSAPDCPPLDLVIYRAGDRFLQTIGQRSSGDGDHLQPIVRSLETADAAWPASPPLQQVDSCELSAGKLGVVAVGLAGRSHWSLAVVEAGDRWRFEAACRVTTPPDWLGSTYQVEPDYDVESTDRQIEIRVADSGRLRFIANAATRLQWDVDSRQIRCEPGVAATRLPATVIWTYEAIWLPNS